MFSFHRVNIEWCSWGKILLEPDLRTSHISDTCSSTSAISQVPQVELWSLGHQRLGSKRGSHDPSHTPCFNTSSCKRLCSGKTPSLRVREIKQGLGTCLPSMALYIPIRSDPKEEPGVTPEPLKVWPSRKQKQDCQGPGLQNIFREIQEILLPQIG